MIECKKSKVSIIEDDILFINIESNQEFCLFDYKEIKLASLKLTSNLDVFNLIHLGDKTIPNKEAREACAKDIGNGCVKAEAIIIYSLGQRILARHILKEKKKKIPVKLFTNKMKAKKWLRKIKKEMSN